MSATVERASGMKRYYIAHDVEHDGYRVTGERLTKGFESVAEAREILYRYQSSPETQDAYIAEVTTFC